MTFDYITINRNAYDSLADEYYERLLKNDAYNIVGKHLTTLALKEMKKINPKKKYNILELGCGPGAILAIFNESNNYDIYAIDISSRMIHYAQKLCEKAIIKNENVLDVVNIKNSNEIEQKMDLIFMAAFIHLFPRSDAKIILEKIKTWLVPNGIIYIDTTEEQKFIDGEITEKTGYGMNVKRLRCRYTLADFNTLIVESGFEIVRQNTRVANSGKKWIRTIAKLCS